MTWPRDYRRATETGIRNDINMMNDSRLQNFMRYEGPEIPPHAKDVIEDELEQRRMDRMMPKAEHSFQNQQSLSSFDSSEFGQLETLDGIDPIDGGLGTEELPGDSIDPVEPVDYIESPDVQSGAIDGGADAAAIQQLQRDFDLDRDEAEALLKLYEEFGERAIEILQAKQVVDQILGAIAAEAILMKEASDKLYELSSRSPEIMLASTETTDKLVKYLWEEYPPEERAEYLEPIFEGADTEIVGIVEELASESDVGVQRG